MLNIKKDGRHRARLVALGYRQLIGVDYNETYSPMVNDVTLRIMLMLKMVNSWKIVKIDVECAFLNATLDEEVYVNLPQGFSDHFKTTSQNSTNCFIIF